MFASKRTRLYLLSILGIMVFGLAFVGCEGDDGAEGPAGPAGGSAASMYGWVQAGEDWGYRKSTAAGDPVSAIIHVDNVPGVPVVTANGDVLAIEPELTIYGGGLGYHGVTTTDADDSVVVEASFTGLDGTDKEVFARLGMVGDFNILVPDTDDVDIPLGDSLTVSWSAASDATEYWYTAYFDCDYTDTAGNYKYWSWSCSRTTTSTTVTFPADSIWGPLGEIDSVRYMDGDFDVYAVNGAALSGGPGNVTGDGMGVVLCMTYGGDLDIDEADGAGKIVAPTGNADVPDFEALFRQNILGLQK
ncbi:MAG: hypothetical protein GY867_03735 [bacterium]|nr:hypothetical protein [bacterium]